MTGKRTHRKELRELLEDSDDLKKFKLRWGLRLANRIESTNLARSSKTERQNRSHVVAETDKFLRLATENDLEKGVQRLSKHKDEQPNPTAKVAPVETEKSMRAGKFSTQGRYPYNVDRNSLLAFTDAKSGATMKIRYQLSSNNNDDDNNNNVLEKKPVKPQKSDTLRTDTEIDRMHLADIFEQENIFLARNPSTIQLSDIRETGDVNVARLDCYCWLLKYLSAMLMFSGFSMLIFITVISMNSATVDFFRDYMLKSGLTFIFILGGTSYPTIVGIYCLFALSKLNHIRPFFLRIPFTTVFPLGLLISSSVYVNSVPHVVGPYLKNKMSEYVSSSDARHTWNTLQELYSCCGIYMFTEWPHYLNSSFEPRYPKSCCKNEEDVNCPRHNLGSAFHEQGCKIPVQTFNVGLGVFLVVLSVIQILLVMASVWVMMLLYNLIKNKMDDSRTSCKIIFGKCYSICDSNEFDRQQEQAEQRQRYFKDLVKNLPT